MSTDLFRLTATEVVQKIKNGEFSVQSYATSLLDRIASRDEAVQAWAYLDPRYVLEQAKALDAIPISERGPLHGVAIAVKDVIFTKGRCYNRQEKTCTNHVANLSYRYANTVQLIYVY